MSRLFLCQVKAMIKNQSSLKMYCGSNMDIEYIDVGSLDYKIQNKILENVTIKFLV